MSIQKYREQLPTEAGALLDYILLSREKLKAYRVKFAACDRLDVAREMRDQTLKEGQQIAEELLHAEARFGELLGKTVKAGNPQLLPQGNNCKLPDGVSPKMSFQCQNLARYPEIIEQVAARAREEDRLVTRKEVLREILLAERPKPGKTGPFPEGHYPVISADPPWHYRDTLALDGYNTNAAENNYPTMSTADLCALPIRTITHDDSVLFLWATFPLLPDALEVIGAWSFTYKTAFVWDKGAGAFGHYHNAAAELLLLSTRGSCLPADGKREDQVQCWPRGRHSEKPAEFRAMIDRLYPQGPRIELFARGDLPPPWVGWGYEASDG